MEGITPTPGWTKLSLKNGTKVFIVQWVPLVKKMMVPQINIICQHENVMPLQ